tara:strand:- start:121 stop:702 length:582 start_codon:yes stop_codon:yes gene_type:complete
MAVGDANLSVFLRNGNHSGTSGGILEATIKLMLKVEQFTCQVSRSPIQISGAAGTVELLDLGFMKPSLTISGIIDTVGTDRSNSSTTALDATNFSGLIPKSMTGVELNGETYYIPYKNFLEKFLLEYSPVSSRRLELEVGDSTTPISTSGAHSTGGAIYPVLVQQVQFTLAPGMEDRYLFTIGFVAQERDGVF